MEYGGAAILAVFFAVGEQHFVDAEPGGPVGRLSEEGTVEALVEAPEAFCFVDLVEYLERVA